MSFRFIDLFAGLGHFALGDLGRKRVFERGSDKEAQRTYRAILGKVLVGNKSNEQTKKLISGGFDMLRFPITCSIRHSHLVARTSKKIVHLQYLTRMTA
jgi:hypothetical protein